MFLCVGNTAAEYKFYTRLSIPEGAKARIGKGSINEISDSTDGTQLAVASSIGIWMYDAGSGEVLSLLTKHTGDVSSVAFSSDGSTIASGSRAGTVLLWEFNPQASINAEVAAEPLAIRSTTLGKIKRTALLQNFPNPFNPETRIPYQLSDAGDVKLSIYGSKSLLVRRIDLGHRLAGYYTDKQKATHWYGRNNNGETVGSRLYFTQLATSTAHHLRRMVILK